LSDGATEPPGSDSILFRRSESPAFQRVNRNALVELSGIAHRTSGFSRRLGRDAAINLNAHDRAPSTPATDRGHWRKPSPIASPKCLPPGIWLPVRFQRADGGRAPGGAPRNVLVRRAGTRPAVCLCIASTRRDRSLLPLGVHLRGLPARLTAILVSRGLGRLARGTLRGYYPELFKRCR